MTILSPIEVDALVKSADLNKKELNKDIREIDPEIKKKTAVLSGDKKEQDDSSPVNIAMQFEKKYPALELVLSRFLDFFSKIIDSFFPNNKGVLRYQG